MSTSGLHLTLPQKDVNLVLAHIEGYWEKLIKYNPRDLKSLIGLPNPYIIPSDVEVFQEQYYWDSYPVVRALLHHKKYGDLAVGIVDNFLYMIERFGIIPNANRFYFLSRSQPPLLSSMVWAVYYKTRDKKWFKRAMKLVEYEYENVWMGNIHLSNFRHVYNGLSRFYDINALDVLAEAESGWDMTARFEGKCMNFVPVDLNCLLYLYERDLAKAYEVFGRIDLRDKYRKLAVDRAMKINELMWDEETGYYFDYNYVDKKRSHLVTTAGTFPLNVGIASNEQAARVAEIVKRDLQKKWGVVQSVRFVENFQWDWPNGWAPIQLRVVEGLMRYGYNKLAKRLIMKWLLVNIKVFKETGSLWEKYDVVNGNVGVPDRYPTPFGFAWTNACFLILYDIYKFLDEHGHEGTTPLWLVRRIGWL